MSAHTDGDSQCPRELPGALHAEGAINEAWMPEVAHHPMCTNELRMCANFHPPHLVKMVAHALVKDDIPMHGDLGGDLGASQLLQ